MRCRIPSFLQLTESYTQCSIIYDFSKNIRYMLAIQIRSLLGCLLELPTVFLYRLMLIPPPLYVFLLLNQNLMELLKDIIRS